MLSTLAENVEIRNRPFTIFPLTQIGVPSTWIHRVITTPGVPANCCAARSMAAKAADSFPYRKTKSLNKCSGFLKTCVNRAPISPYLAITSLISAAEGIRTPPVCRNRAVAGFALATASASASSPLPARRAPPLAAACAPLASPCAPPAACRLRQGTDHQPELLACPPPVARVVGVVELPEVVVDSIDDGLAQLLASLAAGDERAHAIDELARVAGHGGNGLARLQQAHAAAQKVLREGGGRVIGVAQRLQGAACGARLLASSRSAVNHWRWQRLFFRPVPTGLFNNKIFKIT